MKKPSWLNWTTLLLMIILYGFLAGILFAFIYACYVAINDDDIVYNILGWVLITYAVGIGIYIPTLNFTEWLKKKNILNKSYKKIKILGSGNITIKLDIEADFSSKSAKDKIEKNGGTLNILKK